MTTAQFELARLEAGKGLEFNVGRGKSGSGLGPVVVGAGRVGPATGGGKPPDGLGPWGHGARRALA